MSTSVNRIENPPLFALITIMILTGMFGLLGTDIYAPSLPLIPHLFSTTTTLSQLTITVFVMGLSFAQLIAGMLSDIYGRRPVLIIGLLVFCGSTIMCASTSSILFLLIGRVFQGIGAGSVTVLSRILLRDLFSGIKMAQIGSYLAAVIVLSPSLAPVIGGFIQEMLGFKAIFIFLLLFALVLFYLVQFYLPETNQHRHLHQLSLSSIVKKYQHILSHKVFLANVIATGCGLGVIVACAIVNPFLLQNNLHFSPAQYGLWAFLGMFGLFVGMLANGHLVPKWGIKYMMYLGIIIILLAALSFILFSTFSLLTIATVITPTFFISLAAAFILPNALAGAFTPFPEMAGTVGAVYGCLQMLITSAVTFIISIFAIHTQWELGIVIGGLSLVGGFFYHFWGTTQPL